MAYVVRINVAVTNVVTNGASTNVVVTNGASTNVVVTNGASTNVVVATVVITNADISIVVTTNVWKILFDQMLLEHKLQALTYELPYLQKEVANDSASSG